MSSTKESNKKSKKNIIISRLKKILRDNTNFILFVCGLVILRYLIMNRFFLIDLINDIINRNFGNNFLSDFVSLLWFTFLYSLLLLELIYLICILIKKKLNWWIISTLIIMMIFFIIGFYFIDYAYGAKVLKLRLFDGTKVGYSFSDPPGVVILDENFTEIGTLECKGPNFELLVEDQIVCEVSPTIYNVTALINFVDNKGNLSEKISARIIF